MKGGGGGEIGRDKGRGGKEYKEVGGKVGRS